MPRLAGPGGRRRTIHAFALLLWVIGGCSSSETPSVAVSRRYPLPVTISDQGSIRVAWGRIWVSDRGRLTVLDRDGRVASEPREITGAVRLMATGRATLYFADAGGGVIAVDPRTAEPRGRRPGAGAEGLASDPRAREIYLLSPHGGVLGVTADSLVPSWGWPERGETGTAVAVSPLGDRVYHALGGEDPVLLTRDAQSGRILAETEMRGQVRGLLAGRDGVLYALTVDGSRGALLALRPVPGGLDERWRTSLGGVEAEAPLRLALAPDEDRVAVVSRVPEVAGGVLRLFATESGMATHAPEPGVVDAAFGADGALYLLRGGRVRSR
ncbi:MAG: hypothetical protein M3483_06250 [Gemmatimonadota bacterium]|nr:hypothetical protein [Gemmatimonadota bacterium]